MEQLLLRPWFKAGGSRSVRKMKHSGDVDTRSWHSWHLPVCESKRAASLPITDPVQSHGCDKHGMQAAYAFYYVMNQSSFQAAVSDFPERRCISWFHVSLFPLLISSLTSLWISKARGNFALEWPGCHVSSTSKTFSGSGVFTHWMTLKCSPWNSVIPPHA